MLADEVCRLGYTRRIAGGAQAFGIACIADQKCFDFLAFFPVDRSIAAEMIVQASHDLFPIVGGQQRGLIGNVTAAALGLETGGGIGWHRQAISQRREGAAEMEARKDAAYLERNQVVAALARVFPSGIARTAIEGWSEDWHGCVYIDLPTGQVSWHYHDSQAYLFEGLPPYAGAWDGHDTPEKYRRLAALDTSISAARREERERCREQALAAVNTGLRIARIDAEIATPMLGALDAAFDALGEP